MAKRKLSEREQLKRNVGRAMEVYKRDDMIQRSRHQLTVQEQRCVLYAISKIKPEDTAFSEYIFDIKDFYALCGIENESYTDLKNILIKLKSKSWWVEIDDKGTQSAVSWFNTVRTNQKSGKVAIKFHEDMMPFLLELTKQKEFYTGFSLKYVLPMSSQYAPRLYELLKSYQKNNRIWFFETSELKRLLNAENYKNFNDFKKRVLDPSVEEINQFTDISVAYDTHKEGRRVARVEFYMVDKTPEGLLEAERAGREELDGQMNFDEMFEQATDDTENSVKAKFFRDNPQWMDKK